MDEGVQSRVVGPGDVVQESRALDCCRKIGHCETPGTPTPVRIQYIPTQGPHIPHCGRPIYVHNLDTFYLKQTPPHLEVVCAFSVIL